MSNNRTFRNAHQPRMLSNDVVAINDDAGARAKINKLPNRCVVLRIGSKSPDHLGLPATTTTPEQLEEKLELHRVVAEYLGIDGDAYRDRYGLTHNGIQVIENEMQVRLDALVTDLRANGFKLIHASWFQKSARPGKKAPDPTLHFTFSLDGEEMPASDRIESFFREALIDGLFVWKNPKLNPDKTLFGLDTVNAYQVNRPRKAEGDYGTRLHFDLLDGSSDYDLRSL